MSEHFPGGLSNAVYIMVRDFPGLLFCIGDAVLLEAFQGGHQVLVAGFRCELLCDHSIALADCLRNRLSYI